MHERTSAHALWVEDGRCAGVVTESAAIPAAATVLATGGAAALWQRTTNPRGAIGSGLTLAHDAGAALADLEFMQFHPTAVAVPRRPRRLPRHRGGARRRRAAGERRRRALRGRAGAAGRGHARDRRALMSAGRRAFLDLRPVDMRAFPNIVERLARRRNRSGARPRAGRARGALHDRRRRDGRARPLDAARPLRGRRVRLHRRARRQPARLELALGVLRLRPARGAVRGRGAGARPERPAARRPTRRPARTRRLARPSGATRAPYETRPGSSAWRPIRTRSPG